MNKLNKNYKIKNERKIQYLNYTSKCAGVMIINIIIFTYFVEIFLN